MLIIFGWGKKTIKNYGPAYMVKCGNCSISTTYHLICVRTWFTLYRIPVIPYLSEYFCRCRNCNVTYRLDKDGTKNAKSLVKTTALYLQGKMTKNEYNALLNNQQNANKICNPDNSWECPNCKRHNRNSSYRCAYCGYIMI